MSLVNSEAVGLLADGNRYLQPLPLQATDPMTILYPSIRMIAYRIKPRMVFMLAPRFMIAGLSAVLLMGCTPENFNSFFSHSSAPQKTPTTAPVLPVKPLIAATQPLPSPTTLPGSPEDLAQKTASYAERVRAALALREKKLRTSTTQLASPAPVPVHHRNHSSLNVDPLAPRWSDPEDMSLTAQPDTFPAPIIIQQPSEPMPIKQDKPAPATPAPVLPHPTPLPSSPAPVALSTDALQQKILRRLKDNPRDLADHLNYQLVQFLQGASVPQLGTLSSLPSEDREMMTAVLDGLSNFRAALRRDNDMLLSSKIQPLLEMSDRLRAQAALSIPTVTLCTRVDGFGVYEPIDPPRFVVGREQAVILYCEVSNFASRLTDRQKWETRLTQETVLYTDAGARVWQDATRTVVDLSRNRRHDFFLVKMIKFPATLTASRYILKIAVVDQQANRVAEATLPVQIIPAPAVPNASAGF